jgi:hypothetical protein
MRSRWLQRVVVLIAANTGLLALVASHGHDLMQQQHCEPVVRR